MGEPTARGERPPEMDAPTRQTRDYTRLFVALDHAINTLASDENPEEALRQSFEAATGGFGAKKCLLLLVQSTEPLELRNLIAKGLTITQVQACEQGKSVPKVSASLIRDVVQTKEARVRQDPRLELQDEQTGSAAEGGYSALCAPVLDPHHNNNVLAVLYFQHTEITESYGPVDLAFLSSYAKALGRVFGVLLRERKRRTDAGTATTDIVGTSIETRELRRLLVERYIQAANAPKPWPIFIQGERGVGKELIAKFLHEYSDRRRHPYVVVNCSALGRDTAEARLFGAKKGAYTSSVADEPGYFRAANKGILFLDEIGQISLDVQAMLLRAIENRTITPMGESAQIPVDVLVILATNRNLDEAVRNKEFLPDFYDRFRVQRIELLPLRARPADIPPLVEYFAALSEKRYGKRLLGFSAEAMRALVAYSWPGNVREVERIVDFLVLAANPGARIDREFLEHTYPDVLKPENIIAHRSPIGLSDDIPYDDAVNLFRKDLITARLERHNWNAIAAGKSLQISASTMQRYQKELEIRRPGGAGGVVEEP